MVCSANGCRSVLQEAVFKRLAPAGFEAVRGKLSGSHVLSNSQ
jgi:protein-tyrosine-phosphatase